MVSDHFFALDTDVCLNITLFLLFPSNALNSLSSALHIAYTSVALTTRLQISEAPFNQFSSFRLSETEISSITQASVILCLFNCFIGKDQINQQTITVHPYINQYNLLILHLITQINRICSISPFVSNISHLTV